MPLRSIIKPRSLARIHLACALSSISRSSRISGEADQPESFTCEIGPLPWRYAKHNFQATRGDLAPFHASSTCCTPGHIKRPPRAKPTPSANKKQNPTKKSPKYLKKKNHVFFACEGERMFVLNVVCFFFAKAASIDFRPTSGVRLIPYTKLGGVPVE